jgi:hypothetical protein
MKLFRRSVILAHRYLGIGLSLLAVMWFATGIVMMYAGGMPRLSAEMRIDRLPELDLSRVRVAPGDALESVGVVSATRLSLVSVMDRPAYRIGRDTVFADTGDVLDEIDAARARTVASRFVNLPEDKITHVDTLTSADQWTLQQVRGLLHKFRVDDGEGTEVYVSAVTAEVIQLTTSRSRMLAWIGTIPHWLYFTALRTNQPLWYRIVVWTSGLICVLAVLGLVLTFTQFRRRTPFSLKGGIPYSGWLRWHYISGAVFGVFTLTWAFSGLLSMEPFEWTNARGLEVDRDVFTGGPLEPSRYGAMDSAKWAGMLPGRLLKEVEFVRIQDEPYYVVRSTPVDSDPKQRERLHQPYYVTGRVEPDRLIVAAETLEVRREPFSSESLVARLKTAVPDAPIVDHELLTEYDSYYYSRGGLQPLPILRVRFDDPAQTWVYIDPELSQVVAQINKSNRVERWLYNGLHSLDFAFWYNRRPLWDIGMIVLLLGGLTSSTLGLMLGVRRLRRGVVRTAKTLSDAPTISQHDQPTVDAR